MSWSSIAATEALLVVRPVDEWAVFLRLGKIEQVVDIPHEWKFDQHVEEEHVDNGAEQQINLIRKHVKMIREHSKRISL